jgi:crotonobetainyl-CoA:carnitine CoA-transferase CaiB-like acyl-CoA transferase
MAFCDAVGLEGALTNDLADPAATKASVAALIAARTAEEWQPIFRAADCCVSLVVPLEEAVRDPHFVGRGLFDHSIAGQKGGTMPALPVPIDPQFRAAPTAKPAPKRS